jgi:hypothetical protein
MTFEAVRHLLTLVGCGHLSVDAMAQLAQSIMVSLAPSDTNLRDLARMVGHNGERQLHRWTRRQWWGSLLPPLYAFPMKKPRVMRQDHYALLPHEVFAHVYSQAHDLFMVLFGSREVLASWWAAAATSDTLGQLPPEAERSHTVPIGMHGDDAGVHSVKKVLVVTWGSLAGPRATLDSRILFSMIRDGELKADGVAEAGEEVDEDAAEAPAYIHDPENTLAAFYRVLVWSCNALSAGIHPSCDENGRAFGPGHHPERAAKAGTLLAGGFRCRWMEMRGDWKFLREALLLRQHYGSNSVCHWCAAEKAVGPNVFTDYRQVAPLRATRLSSAAWITRARASPPVSPLLDIVGFDHRRVRFDPMHTLDLGVYQVAVPSALVELCTRGGHFDGANVSARLAAATASYRAWVRRTRVPDKATPFSKAWISAAAGQYPSISQQQAKAGALRSLIYWMHEVCVAAATVEPCTHTEVRAAMFECFVGADKVMRRSDRWMSRATGRAVADHIERALLCYNALSCEAAAAGELRWPVLPKHHALTHIGFDHGGANPRASHCYGDEDMVGRMKRTYSACHGSTAPLRGLQRYSMLTSLRWQHLIGVERSRPRA